MTTTPLSYAPRYKGTYYEGWVSSNDDGTFTYSVAEKGLTIATTSHWATFKEAWDAMVHAIDGRDIQYVIKDDDLLESLLEEREEAEVDCCCPEKNCIHDRAEQIQLLIDSDLPEMMATTDYRRGLNNGLRMANGILTGEEPDLLYIPVEDDDLDAFNEGPDTVSIVVPEETTVGGDAIKHPTHTRITIDPPTDIEAVGSYSGSTTFLEDRDPPDFMEWYSHIWETETDVIVDYRYFVSPREAREWVTESLEWWHDKFDNIKKDTDLIEDDWDDEMPDLAEGVLVTDLFRDWSEEDEADEGFEETEGNTMRVHSKYRNSLEDLIKVQLQNCTDPYMVGLHNGLELARATLQNEDPEYLDSSYTTPPAPVVTGEIIEVTRSWSEDPFWQYVIYDLQGIVVEAHDYLAKVSAEVALEFRLGEIDRLSNA